MLFHITQRHTPELCPKDEGGSKTLYNPQAEGVTLRAMYGAYAEHVLYYIVEADSIQAVTQFLMPSLKRCKCKVTPVADEPFVMQ